MVKRAFLALFLAISAPIIAFGANSFGVGQFSGLDSQDNPASLQPNQSQDLLNVRLQPGGKAVYKRDGYGLFQTLNAVSTAAVHGGYHFQQSGGSDVQLWGSDNGLYASVSDAAFVKIATGTVGATWQCTDNLGYAYCVTSAGDTPVKTDGTAANTSYQTAIPAGTMVMSTPLQLVVAGVSGNPSTIYVSANNNFTNFTTGPLPTDPYTEIINAPGSRLTHLGYYFGNIYWWKDQSMGYMSGTSNQNTIGITIISNQIGTLDNSSAFWNPTTYDQGNKFNTGAQTTSAGNPYFNEMSSLGGIFFRGQDNHVYDYDGYSLTRLSRIITPNIVASSRKKANSWTQSTSGDWNAGTFSSNGGSWINSGGSALAFPLTQEGDTAASDFGAATYNSQMDTSTVSGSYFPKIYMSELFSDFSQWTNQSSNCNGTFSVSGGKATCSGTCCQAVSANKTFPPNWAIVTTYNASVINPDNYLAAVNKNSTNAGYAINPVGVNTVGINKYSNIVDLTGGSSICTGTTATTTGTHTLALTYNGSSGLLTAYFDGTFVCSGTDNTYSTFNGIQIAGGNSNYFTLVYETASTGTINSQVFDTHFSSPIWGTFGATTHSGVNSYTFSLRSSDDGITFGSPVTVTTNTAISGLAMKRYVQYASTLQVNGFPIPQVDDVTIGLKTSSGSFVSPIHNIGTAITSWANLGINQSLNGGSIAYSLCSSTNSNMGYPTSCASQTINSQITIATGSYAQLYTTFTVTLATQTPTINNTVVNWYEGTAADKAYIQYFQDAILFSVSSSSSVSTNNTIFYLDLLNDTWLKDNIPANGFLVENNSLYIGDPLSASVYKFGGVTTDKSAAIQSYWKSKDFTGDDPTVKNDFNQADLQFAESSNTVTFTYLVDQSPSLTFTQSLPLYSTTSSILKRGFTLDRSAVGTFFNFSVGDNSSLAPWTLMGERTTYIPLPWRPQTSL